MGQSGEGIDSTDPIHHTVLKLFCMNQERLEFRGSKGHTAKFVRNHVKVTSDQVRLLRDVFGTDWETKAETVDRWSAKTNEIHQF